VLQLLLLLLLLLLPNHGHNDCLSALHNPVLAAVAVLVSRLFALDAPFDIRAANNSSIGHLVQQALKHASPESKKLFQ